MSSIVQVEGLVKRYRDVRAVDGIDLEVREGEIFGVLGANGAGKTTAVECIQGLRTPDEGTIRLCGLDPTRQREQLRRLVGSQLQDSALPDRIRVREAMHLFSIDRVPSADLLEAWGLADKQRTPYARLSGGQQQRLLIAIALLNSPRVVFLDELTQGLDPAARRETWDVIRAVRDEGTTVVLVTHFADEAEALCDRLTVFRAGKVAANGTPAELINRHARSARVSLRLRAGQPFQQERIELLAGVDRVDRDGDRVEIHGASRMIAYVCAELVSQRAVGDDLRVSQGTLEDALVEMMEGDR